jgi:carbonic anhydrase
MRLFEAIIDANHRAVAGDANASLRPADFASELPVTALTCIDPRLNALFPNVLGLPGEEFIWLRNAGNIITGLLSSTMRSLALACAVKGGREIAIIGHTDCQICKTTTIQLIEELKALGVERSRLPENLNKFFGMFATESQNVIRACNFARQSPLIGPKIPVHGLLVNIETGKLDWVVNGYENWQAAPKTDEIDFIQSTNAAIGVPGSMNSFNFGEMKFPESKIGDSSARTPLIEVEPATMPSTPPLPSEPEKPPKIPLPPAIRPRIVR